MDPMQVVVWLIWSEPTKHHIACPDAAWLQTNQSVKGEDHNISYLNYSRTTTFKIMISDKEKPHRKQWLLISHIISQILLP